MTPERLLAVPPPDPQDRKPLCPRVGGRISSSGGMLDIEGLPFLPDGRVRAAPFPACHAALHDFMMELGMSGGQE